MDKRIAELLNAIEETGDLNQEIIKEAYKLPADQPWQQSGKVVKKAYMTDLLNAIIERVKPMDTINCIIARVG